MKRLASILLLALALVPARGALNTDGLPAGAAVIASDLAPYDWLRQGVDGMLAPPDDAHVFVADPSKGSRHNRGCAADIGLYDLASGRELVMISRYDEMSPRAYADYLGGTARQRWLRARLREAMEAEGFTVYPEEWWHFDFNGWRDFGIGEPSFTTLLAGRTPTPLPKALPPLSGDGP